MAGIDADIMRMPMGYNTLIGDMGTTLSGGQRQRVLLARALYRQARAFCFSTRAPRISIRRSRQQVNAAIGELAITRVIIAHRPQTVAAANRIFCCIKGA